ncbi:hypothetical protein RB195_014209 [Necator americanus]|uniref:Uncharacterized protein n=1 Tax=Necator americanus TaxID=51031 RepID=A0ABR1DZ81_NECAM
MELILMLDTRLTEARNHERRLARNLAGTTLDFRDGEANSPLMFLQQTPTVKSGTISPPRVDLPKFYGNEEEFPEFWAVHETLVQQHEADRY